MIENLRALAVFAKVAETGSFRAAAQGLSLSPSVISHHVGQLEERLGTALIYRSTRKLALTAAGEDLARAARQMIDAAQSGLDRVGGTMAVPAGKLSITAPSVFNSDPFIKAVSDFLSTHERVEISLNLDDKKHDLIAEGLDLAIRVGWLADSSLKSRKLRDEAQVLVASPDFVRGRAPIRHPSDLNERDWIRFTALSGGMMLFHGETRFRIVPDGRISVDSGKAAARFAADGFGVSPALAFMVAEDLAAGRLVEVLPDWRPAPIGIYAVWPPNVTKGSLTRLFVDHLAAALTPAV